MHKTYATLNPRYLQKYDSDEHPAQRHKNNDKATAQNNADNKAHARTYYKHILVRIAFAHCDYRYIILTQMMNVMRISSTYTAIVSSSRYD